MPGFPAVIGGQGELDGWVCGSSSSFSEDVASDVVGV